MLSEVPDSDVLWTEPRDLPLDRLPRLWMRQYPNNARRWQHGGRVSVAHFDGHVSTATDSDAQEIYHDAQVK